METKDWVIWRFFGIDVTPRKRYRSYLQDCLKKIFSLESKLEAEKNKLKAEEGSMKAVVTEFERLKRECEKTQLELAKSQMQALEYKKAYDGAKRQLAKFDRNRGKNGKFQKKNNNSNE